MKRITNVVDVCKQIFAVTDYASAALPTYISLGLVLNGKHEVKSLFKIKLNIVHLAM